MSVFDAGAVICITVTMSEPTVVTPTVVTVSPTLAMNIDHPTVIHFPSSVQAVYVYGSGTTELVFQYTIQFGQTDSDSISFPAIAGFPGALNLANGTVSSVLGGIVTVIGTPSVTLWPDPPLGPLILAVGTKLGERCIGYDRWGWYADGYGGSYTQIEEKNAASCGYVARPRDASTLAAADDKIDQHWFNELTEDINELFGDTHAGEGPTTNITNSETEDNLRWGWGGLHIADVASGQKLSAALTNQLVNRINISTLRTNSDERELVVVNLGEKINESFFNTAIELIDSAREKRNEVDPAFTELNTLATFDSAGTPWANRLEIRFDVNFGGYEQGRHFFNAGGTIRFEFSQRGEGYGAGYHIWRCIFLDQGTLKFDVENLTSANTRGITQDRGYAKVIDIEQLLYTSPSGSGAAETGGYGGYGGYGACPLPFGEGGYGGHGGYSGSGGPGPDHLGGYGGGYGSYASSRAKIYGEFQDGNLRFRILLDNSGMGVLVRGQTRLVVSKTQPTAITENNVTLTLPTPTITLIEDWHLA